MTHDSAEPTAGQPVIPPLARTPPVRTAGLRALLWLLALCLALPGLAQQNQDQPPLTAYVDRSEVTVNEVITLTIRVGSQLGNARPTLSALDRDFVQLGVTTSNKYTNFNGTVQSWTEYNVSIKPRTTGTLTIPSFRVGGEATQPIAIRVGEGAQTSGRDNDEIFLTSSVDKEAIYVQEQLLMTVKLYYTLQFNQGAQLTSPQVEDSVVEQLGEDQSYQELVEGLRYNVIERKFVVFPQASGDLTIPPVYFTAEIGGRGLFGRRSGARQINLSSEPHDVMVMSRPVSFPGETWLPADELSIEETWSRDLEELRVGESVTRNIVITARGLSSSLLPGIEYADTRGLKFYPDQPRQEDSSDRSGVTGVRREGTAIVASQPGEYTLPPVRIPWWNTRTDSLETATLEARTLNVLPTPGGSGQAQFQSPGLPDTGSSTGNGTITPASQTSGVHLFWIIAAVAFAAAWLATTAVLLRNRHALARAGGGSDRLGSWLSRGRESDKDSGDPALPDPDAAFEELRKACRQEDPAGIRRAVITWGQGYFQNRNIRTLDNLKAYCDSPTLAALLFNLEQAIYSDHPEAGEFRSRQLYNEVSKIHKSGRRGLGRRKADYTLPPLYKN